MVKDALNKIQAEVTAKPKDHFVAAIGAYLMDYVRKNPEHAGLVNAEGKTIAGSLEACKAEAKKLQSNGVGVLTDEQAFKIVRKYFGISVPEEAPDPPPPTAPLSMSLDDLL